MDDDSPLSDAMSDGDQAGQQQSLQDIYAGDPGTMLDHIDKAMDIKSKSVANQGVLSRLKSRDTLSNALSNFLFSFGQGMSAQAQAPPGMRGAAGMGAALTAPVQLQQLQQQRALQMAQQKADMMRAQAQQQQANTAEGYRLSQEALNQIVDVTDPVDGSKLTMPLKQKESYLQGRLRVKAATDKQNGVEDAQMLGKYGMIRNPDMDARATQPWIQAPDEMIPPTVKANLERTAALDSIRSAQSDYEKARTAMLNAQMTPGTPEFKRLQDDADAKKQKLTDTMNIALQKLGIQRESLGIQQQRVDNQAANSPEAKGLASMQSAVKYGRDYVNSGQFTGPKDEALLEAFFEVAKPSSGFRMSQPQIDMLMNARSWMESAKGKAYHAETGAWFPPKQREQIVDAMEARAASKAPAAPKGGATGQPILVKAPNGKTYPFKTQAEANAFKKSAGIP